MWLLGCLSAGGGHWEAAAERVAEPVFFYLQVIALPQPKRAVMALPARAMDHELRRVAGERHVPVDPQMISSGFFAEDGFHPSTSGYRARAAQLAGPVSLAVAST
jgi:lysophospholipase L1-like esterase